MKGNKNRMELFISVKRQSPSFEIKNLCELGLQNSTLYRKWKETKKTDLFVGGQLL